VNGRDDRWKRVLRDGLRPPPRKPRLTTTGEKPWVRAEPSGACPVPAAERDWTETWLAWCEQDFGVEAARREVALPLPPLLPAGFTGGPAEVNQLVAGVCAVMDVDPARLAVHCFEGPAPDELPARLRERHRTVGTYRKVLGRSLIELALREAADPAAFAAIVAHELGHVRLLGERRIDGIDVDHERLTDLVTVFLGMGVFNANTAYRFTRSASGFSVLPLGDLTERMLTGNALDPTHHLGYLTEREFGYALACWCRQRGESDPPWAAHLDSGARAAFQQGLRYLASR
jgi:hypothetical protein